MKHCYTVVTLNDGQNTELECALCHQPQADDTAHPRCLYDQKVDVRGDLRVVNHLVENGWSLHTVLDKEHGLVFVLVHVASH